MNITLKQIEAFYWTVQLRSLTRAAEHLSTSQSAMSARIAELEHALGLKLFLRRPRGLHFSMANYNFWLENRMLGFLAPNVGLPYSALPSRAC